MQRSDLKKELIKYGIVLSEDEKYADILSLDKTVSLEDLKYNLKKDAKDLREEIFKLVDKMMEILRERDSSNIEGRVRCLERLFIYNLNQFYKFITSFDFDEFLEKTEEVRFYLNQDIKYFSISNIKNFLNNKLLIDILFREHGIKVYLYELIDSLVNKSCSNFVIKEAAGFQGPWAYFDLPLSHRVIPYKALEMPELTRQRQRHKRYRNGLRNYNTQDVGEGFYWREIRREPYLYSDSVHESTYPTRHSLSHW